MTDPSRDHGRMRRRSGRHQQSARRPQTPQLPPDEARRNRDAAFGGLHEKRTWLQGHSSAPSAQSPSSATPSPAPARPEQPARAEQPEKTEQPAQPAQPEQPPRPEPSEERTRGRRAAFPLEQLDSSPAAGAAASGAAATGAATGAAAASSTDPAEVPPSAPRGRRRAALPADSTSELDAWQSASPESPAAPAARPAVPSPSASPASTPSSAPAGTTASAATTAPAPPPAAPRTGPRSEPGRSSAPKSDDADSGSLPRVAFWTVLTSLIPGSGLLTTTKRRFGAVLLLLVLLAVAGGAVFLLLGDPLRTGVMLATKRGVLIGAMIAVAVVGIVWALQIVLANLAHSTQERLQGAKRYLALALAALMVVAVAVPVTRGVHSLWALQGLVGSRTVFGGDGGDHRFGGGEDPWAGAGRVNIMLLGQDAGADRTGTRPDTIMVASIDTQTGQTALFSIPRNLENVEFPEGTPAAEEFPDGFDYFGNNQDLINAVWTWAEDRPDLFPKDDEPGLTATRWAVEETLGLEMDYYAMVNLQGFEDLVNALGGVEMVVERRIPIGGGAAAIDGYIEPGLQKLDGFHALWYARSREGSNDFNRMCRQQRIVRAVTEEADPTTLAFSIPGLVSATEQNIQTDIPVKNVDAFVDLALRVKDAGFTSYPITQDVTFSGNPDFEYLEEWVQASIDDSMKQEAPESVLGETEPGSTQPAETGAAPEEEGGEESGSAAPTSEEATTEEPTAEEPSEETSEPAESAEATTPPPEIEQDPLKSCLPGAEGAEG